MDYRVTCDCGRTHTVTAADAGASLPCGCGRTVEVPPLHRLRKSAGQTALPAETELRAALLRGEVPGPPGCVCCRRATARTIRVVIVCERAVIESGPGWAKPVGCFLLGLLLGWIVVVREPRERQVLSEELVFTVPLRVCEWCDDDVRDPADVRELLQHVPIYAALLEKYPAARVSRAG